MKKLIMRLWASLFALLLFVNCTKEEPLQLDAVQETEQSSVLVEQVDFNSIPELSEALNNVSGESKLARSYSEKGDSKYWIDEGDVLKLRDSVSNESYSIDIHSDDPSPTSFYNLVVTKRTDGNPIVPFVVEYNFENGDVFSFARDDEKKFDGTVNIYSLEEFANATGLNARDSDPVICFQDVGQQNNTVAGSTDSGGASTGSSGSSSGSTSGSSGGASFNTGGAIVYSNRATEANAVRGSVVVGVGTMYLPRTIERPKGGDQKISIINDTGSNQCPEGWVSIPINEIDDIPPSCESFNFRNTTSFWQEAAVKGIKFKIVLVSPKGIKGVNTVSFLQPILFGLPSNYTVGGNLSAGSAAELSAKILDITMDEIVRRYSNASVGDSYIEIKFRELLIKNYRDYTGGGGRVQFNYSGSIPSTPYETNFFGTGNCD